MKRARRIAILLALFCCLACQQQTRRAHWGYEAQPSHQKAPDLTVQIEFLEERLEKRPRAFLEMAELAGLYLQRSRSRRSQADLEKSQMWVERSLSEIENNGALLVRADHMQMRHEFSEALHLVDKVLGSEPGNLKAQVMGIRILLARGEVDLAAQRARDLPESPLSSLSFLRAQVCEAEGNIEAAREFYTLAVRKEMDGASALESARRRAVFARMEMKVGRTEEARELLEAAYAIPVDQPLVPVLQAQLLSREGELEKAKSLLNSAFTQYRDGTMLVRLGEIQLDAGEKADALKSFENAAKLLEDDVLGHERDLALCYFYISPQKKKNEIAELMSRELSRRKDKETLRIRDLVLSSETLQ